ncbi:MAG: IPT/TIG domain-containing protein, partial [Desulfobacterales bacterium]|nr:IPT/TIG domain-containing protein [Desulfobacterales bacterium]
IEPTSVIIKGEIDGIGTLETFTDNGNGTLTSDAIPAGTGTINYVTGAVSVTFNTAPFLDTDVTADYSYYEESTVSPYLYVVTPLAGITTNATGSFEASIIIPAILEDDYGNYTVTAVDAKGNKPTAIIAVNYYITVKPEKGPPGIKVDVSGRVEPAKSVEVKFGRGATFVTAFTTTSDADGYFSGEYTLPTLLEPAADYEFRAIWDAKERTTPFQVLPAPTITLTPATAAAGAKVTISGEDFSAKANVTVYFDTTVVNTTATTFLGAFTCTFIVPTVATGTYKVKAVDQYGASAEKYFTVVPPPAI